MNGQHLILTILVVGMLVACGKKENMPANDPSPEANAPTTPASPPSTPNPEARRLLGKWLRPDGGYVIEIKAVDDASGKLDAAYYNPQPIHVSKATATREGTGIRVFIELQAPNYPGSTYTLAYDPAADQLQGIYFQATLKQQFEVVFQRLK